MPIYFIFLGKKRLSNLIKELALIGKLIAAPVEIADQEISAG